MKQIDKERYEKFLVFYKATIEKPSQIDKERRRIEVLLYEHCLDEVDYNPRMAALDEVERHILRAEKTIGRWLNAGQIT